MEFMLWQGSVCMCVYKLKLKSHNHKKVMISEEHIKNKIQSK